MQMLLKNVYRIRKLTKSRKKLKKCFFFVYFFIQEFYENFIQKKEEDYQYHIVKKFEKKNK